MSAPPSATFFKLAPRTFPAQARRGSDIIRKMPAQLVACPIPPCLVALGPQTWTSSRGPIAGPSKPASRSLWLQNWSARSPGPHSGLIRRTQCSRLETGRKGRGFSSGLVLKRAERRLLPFPRFGFILWSYVPQRMRARENLYS